jgi:hypothetical protein
MRSFKYPMPLTILLKNVCFMMICCESLTNKLTFACKRIFLPKLEKQLVWF